MPALASLRKRCGWRLCFVYLLVFLLLPKTSVATAADATLPPLNLHEASHRVLEQNPELQVFRWRFSALEGRRAVADLRPGYELMLEAENVLGSGEFSNADSAELTLSLSSVIELGDKRQSRRAVADAHYQLTQAEREAFALDLLGRVTRNFISTLALQEKLALTRDAAALAETSQQLVNERVEQGASPKAEQLRAQAELVQARLRQNALAAKFESAKLALATSWGATQADFGSVSGELFRFEQTVGFEELFDRVSRSAAIQVFAQEARLREAELALARSQSRSNLNWSLGIRRFEEADASALTAGLSVPLFSGRRSRGEVQTALAEREMLDHQRQSALLSLRLSLFEAWQSHQQSVAAARQIRSEILPALEQALDQTRLAYQQGRYSYRDWVGAQRELLEARLALIDAAQTALLNQALIEQLTAEPLASSGGH